MNFKIFSKDIPFKKLERETFSFNHNLKDSPLLTLEHLLSVIPNFPKEKVAFSASIKNLEDNFDNIIDSSKLENAEELKNKLMNDNALIAIRNLELEPSLRPIYNAIIHDIELIMQANKIGTTPIDPQVWLFIASPNAVTPFHFDRSSNFIFQIRGSKLLAVFPPKDERVMSKETYEAYMDWNCKSPVYDESIDHLGFKHDFKSGMAAHIPFTSGHYVQNGSDDISITISIFFQTDETLRWTNVMRLNNRLRKMKIKTNMAGVNDFSDKLKSSLFPIFDKTTNLIRK